MDDFLFKTVSLAICSTIEPGIAIFAASLATLRPLLRRFFPNYFPNVAIAQAPELHIPAYLARKEKFSDDLEMGDTTITIGNESKSESESKNESQPPRASETPYVPGIPIGESSRTIEIHLGVYLDKRDESRHERRSSTASASLYRRTSATSSAFDDLENVIEEMDSPYTPLGPSPHLPPLDFSSNFSPNMFLQSGRHSRPPTLLLPASHPPSRKSSIPSTLLSPTHSALLSPSSLSPSSHVANCMRESQYIRNSKVVVPSSPI